MGNYLEIPINDKRTEKLMKWFNKWKPFFNDFGDEHNFEDVFGELNFDNTIRFKFGVMERNFYPEKAMKEIKKLILEFGGTYKE